MHTASALLRNSVLSNPHFVTSPSRLARSLTRIASQIQRPVERSRVLCNGYNFYRSRNVHICGYSPEYPSVVRTVGSARLFSTGNKEDPPEDDGDAKLDSPLFSHLPATVAVPEVWPQVPVIAINRNPVFPRFIKLIEVRRINLNKLCFVYRSNYGDVEVEIKLCKVEGFI